MLEKWKNDMERLKEQKEILEKLKEVKKREEPKAPGS